MCIYAQEVRLLVRQGGLAEQGALMEASRAEAAAEASQTMLDALLSSCAEQLPGLQAEARSVPLNVRCMSCPVESTVWSVTSEPQAGPSDWTWAYRPPSCCSSCQACKQRQHAGQIQGLQRAAALQSSVLSVQGV